MEWLSECIEFWSSHKKCFPGVYISIEKKLYYAKGNREETNSFTIQI